MGGGWLFSGWLGGALAVGLAISAWQAQRIGLARGSWADALLSALIGGALGARLGGFLLDGAGSGKELWFALLDAPLSLLGAIVGALVALRLWGKKRADGWMVADVLMLGVLAAATLLWLGASQVGVACGQPYFGAGNLRATDAYGVVVPRWPVQVVGAGACSALALLLMLLPRRAVPDGTLALVGGWGLLLLLFALDFWRGEAGFLLGPFRVEQLGYLVALTLVALALPQRWRSGHG